MKRWMIAVAMAGSLAAANADVYKVDPVHSRLGFGVRHMVVSTVEGHFKTFAGQFEFTPSKPGDFKAEGTAEIDSVSTDNDDRDKHLKSPDFFDAKKYPQLKFVATGLEAKGGSDYVLGGKLTIKGVTKDVSFPVTISGPVTDPRGSVRVGVEGSVKINRKDFGLNFDGRLSNGDMLVGDDVKISLSVEGVKETAPAADDKAAAPAK